METNPPIAWLDRPYALFAGQTYYASPGWYDYRCQHASIEEASEVGKLHIEEDGGWWQVVDLRTLQIVAGEGKAHTGLFGYSSAGPICTK